LPYVIAVSEGRSVLVMSHGIAPMCYLVRRLSNAAPEDRSAPFTCRTASGAGHVQGREIPDWQWCSLPALDALDRRSDELEWWDNPFADQPVPYDVIPEVADRCQLVVDDMGVGHLSKTEARRALGSVFDC
jgi:hypothetical protein